MADVSMDTKLIIFHFNMPYVRVRRSKNASNYGLGMPAGYRRSLPPPDSHVIKLEKAG